MFEDSTREPDGLNRRSPLLSMPDLPPLGMDPPSLAEDFRRHFSRTLGGDRYCTSGYCSAHYPYEALALSIRDRLMERWKRTRQAYEATGCRRAYYLSLEYLLGRTLGNSLLNLGIRDATAQGLQDLSLELEAIADSEPDAGLGNGGLGRLAACFLDSCATLQLPVRGYGLRYEYGMFRQGIQNGHQVEEPDHWLRDGYPWERERPEFTQRVQFGGRTEFSPGPGGRTIVRWLDTQDVMAVPYDLPIPGYRNDTVNSLRLWAAQATEEFDLREFNAGSYPEAVAKKNNAEHITMVLYPNDASENGKELRLRQQYFLASASLKDVLREWVEREGPNFAQFAAKHCFQLNDTHPAISVAELMRLLVDVHGLDWEPAWQITRATMAYTNHTLLPEALERWPVRLFRHLLPRLLEIIFEINARFLTEVASRWPGDMERQRRMSLIEEGHEPMVRMAYLAIVGSFSVNGVAALHSRLLQEGMFRDFHELWPQRFNNKTNGVTPRRWLSMCNPALAELISDRIGSGWTSDMEQLKQLEQYLDDGEFRQRWAAVKRANKQRLADLVLRDCSVAFDPDALFDVQVKRIHEYKRQLLNVLHLIHLYLRIKRGDTQNWTPRCALIGGKAAPGYQMAKTIIKLVNNVARVINQDPDNAGLLRVAFIKDYRVSAMEVICAGTDLSEQISTAGKEASGTGNMKFMMNGAVTIGTLDGANIEIRDAVGADNFFLFGLTAAEVEQHHRHYDPAAIIAQDDALREVLDLLQSGHFNQFEPGVFDPILQSIRSPEDPWMTAADFHGYLEAQREAAAAYRDQRRWVEMSISNTANSGRFSSDRTIAEYNRDIWHLTPAPRRP